MQFSNGPEEDDDRKRRGKDRIRVHWELAVAVRQKRDKKWLGRCNSSNGLLPVPTEAGGLVYCKSCGVLAAYANVSADAGTHSDNRKNEIPQILYPSKNRRSEKVTADLE